jgi:hypothetical protein
MISAMPALSSAPAAFSVGGDQRLPQKLMQNREHHRGEHFIANTQRDIAAAIVFNNLRINVFTAEIREVSTWEIKPMAGISPSTLAGRVPITVPFHSALP